MKPLLQRSSSASVAWSAVKAMHMGNRGSQEDAACFWLDPSQRGLFAIVADGAGGHGGGAEASAAAIAQGGKCWRARRSHETHEQFLRDWIVRTQAALHRDVTPLHPEARTAVVAAMLTGNRVDWVHAGDCRLYHFRQGKLLSRTRDHSVVQVLFEQGQITEEQMGTHEDQNRLLQAIGGSEPPKAVLGGADLQPDDFLLLCSDGFWERLNLEEITCLAAIPSRQRKEMLGKVLQLAVDRGGAKSDNGSVIIIHAEGRGEKPLVRVHWVSWLLLVLLIGTLITWFLALEP